MNPKEDKFYSYLERLRSIVSEGLQYSSNEYETERYESIRQIIIELYSQTLAIPTFDIAHAFVKDAGTLTPKIGVEAVVPDLAGRFAAIKRTDDSCWCLPCGWMDVGESPIETALREVFEETGIRVSARGYIGIADKGPEIYPKLVHQVNLMVLCNVIDLHTLRIQLSHEHSEFTWVDDPTTLKWHPGHERSSILARNFLDGDSMCIIEPVMPPLR